MSETTDRFALPLLQAGQAQKEITHNEALVLIDGLLHPAVSAFDVDDPPSSPVTGDSFIIGTAPTGAWTGQAGRLACWTEGGWRIVVPHDGMLLWDGATGELVLRRSGQWTRRLATGGVEIAGQQVVGPRAGSIEEPAGGDMVDVEARATLALILAMLRNHGLIAA